MLSDLFYTAGLTNLGLILKPRAVVADVFWQKGERTTPDKTFQTKDPLQIPPDKNHREQLREKLYRGLLSGIYGTIGLLKIGMPEMCDVLWGGPGMCDIAKYDRRRGSNWPKIEWRTLWTAPFLLFHCMYYVTILFIQGFYCFIICLLAYVTALFSASIVPSSVCYATILFLQGIHCSVICLLRHICIALFSASAVSSSICCVTIYIKISIVSISVCYDSAVFSASIV